jgi:hypothetical protein
MAMNHVDIAVLSPEVMTPSTCINLILHTIVFSGLFMVTIICSLLPEGRHQVFIGKEKILLSYWSFKIKMPGTMVAEMDLKYKLIGRNKTRY